MKCRKNQVRRCNHRRFDTRRASHERLEDRALLSGVEPGAEFPVNSFVTGNQFMSETAFHSVASDSAGNFVIVWQNQYFIDADIFARRFNKLGVPLGDEFRVNTHIASAQESPSIAMASDGRFAIV